MAASRNSDRWITPGVIIAALIVGGVVIGMVAASVTYLAAQGLDPDPMIRLVAQVATSVGALGTLILQLAGRATAAKTERNTGTLANVVADAIPPAVQAIKHVDQDDAPWPPPLEEDTTEHLRPAVPPLPAFPRHSRTRSSQL